MSRILFTAALGFCLAGSGIALAQTSNMSSNAMSAPAMGSGGMTAPASGPMKSDDTMKPAGKMKAKTKPDSMGQDSMSHNSMSPNAMGSAASQ